MLLHLIERRTSFADKRGDAFHYEMFHGDATREGCELSRVEYTPSDQPMVALSLSRNVFRLPHLFQPMAAMVVSDTVKKRLCGFPGLKFLKVLHKRLFYYPWFEFDFSYYDTVGDYEEYMKLIENFPHDQKYETIVPAFYEMITEKSLWWDDQSDGSKASVKFAFEESKKSAKVIELDMDKVNEYPVTWAMGHIFHSDAFDCISPLVDWGFFSHGTAEV
jgi:hypothetical protein